ncbi:MAG: hypothetical protein RLZZ30_1491 [Bacteroidota bacterium]
MLSMNDSFDQEVKKVLNETSQEEIPADFLVDIELRLDQLEKKKKRRIFAWFFFGAVLASALTLGLLRKQEFNNPQARTTPSNFSHSSQKSEGLKSPVTFKGTGDKETSTLESCALTEDSKKTKNGSSKFIEKAPLNPLSGKNPNHLIGATTTYSGIELSQVQLETTLLALKDRGMNSAENRQTLIATDSSQSETARTTENTQKEVLSSKTNPEVAQKISVPKWTRTFGFYTGMSGVLSSFQTDDNALQAVFGAPNVSKYRALRTAQERSTSSIDLSLRYRMAKENLVLQTGLDFFEWGEQIQYDYSFAYDGINRYSYLSLPFYLGYRKAFQSFEWSANIGCSIGHVLQQKGRYIQPDLVTLALENTRTWSATGLAQLEFIYTVDRYRFLLAPTYRMSFGNVVNSTYTKNRYFSIGLQMGMAYQF